MPIFIESLEFREIALPLKSPFRSAAATVTRRRLAIVRMVDAEGVEGWGECVALEDPGYLPETIDTAWLAMTEWLAPRIVGKEFSGPGPIYDALRASVRGHNMAIAAIEMAGWDLVARKKKLPLAEILGGTRQEVATGIALGLEESTKELVDAARKALDEGYARLKIKIHPGADVKPLQALRDHISGDVALWADANCSYGLEDVERLKALDGLNLEMIEQPLAWDDLIRHATLQQQIDTPICLDESISGPDRVADMIALGSGRVVNLKPGRVGGLTPSLVIHNLCMAHGIPLWCGGMLESGVGRAHNVALASLPNFTLPGDLSPSTRYWERDIVSPEWTMDGKGMVKVPLEKPGIGVDIDKDRIESLTLRKKILTSD